MANQTLIKNKDFKMEKHYIVDKDTNEVMHGPYPSEDAAKTAAEHHDWFDPEKHEVASGTHEMQDIDDTEVNKFDQSDVVGEFFLLHPSCDLPLAGPFSSEDEALEFKIVGVTGDLKAMLGSISEDGTFRLH